MTIIRYLLAIGLVILVVGNTSSQEIITSSGDYQTSAQGSLSWTIGEPITETITSNDGILTQGFQQNYEDIVYLEENTFFNNLSIFPNPFRHSIHISGEGNNNHIKIIIFDIQGKEVYKHVLQLSNLSIKHSIDLSHLDNGMYTLEISDESYSRRINKKIIKLSNTP